MTAPVCIERWIFSTALIRSLIALALSECFEAYALIISSLTVIIPDASLLSKGGTNPSCTKYDIISGQISGVISGIISGMISERHISGMISGTILDTKSLPSTGIGSAEKVLLNVS